MFTKPASKAPVTKAAPAMTIAQTRLWVAKQIKAQHPAAKVAWVMPLKAITFPTGMRGIVGQIAVKAPGMKPGVLLVTVDPYTASVK